MELVHSISDQYLDLHIISTKCLLKRITVISAHASAFLLTAELMMIRDHLVVFYLFSTEVQAFCGM